MARRSLRGNARFSIVCLQVGISWIAMGSLWGLLASGNARGQDLVPAPPDRERAEGVVAPFLAPFPPEAAAEVPKPGLLFPIEDLGPPFGVHGPGSVDKRTDPAKPPTQSTSDSLARADTYLRSLMFDQALELYQMAIAYDRTSVRGHRGRAHVMMHRGRHKEALDDVDYVIGRDHENLEALQLRALCLMQIGLTGDNASLDAALTAVDRILGREPDDALARAIRGVILTRKGDFDRAIAELSYAIEHQGAIVAKNGGLDPIPELSNTIEQQVGRIKVYYYRGIARMRKRDYERALDDFNEIARYYDLDRIPSQILTDRGRCYAACGDLDRAISEFSAVIKKRPKEYQLYRLRAEAYLEKKDLDHALADHNQIVKLRPDDSMVYLTRSFLRWEKGDNAGALADMDRAVQLSPQACGPYFCRAVLIVLSQEDDDRAIADMDRAVALEPRFPFFYAFRGYLRAEKLKCVPALKDLALCFCTLDQYEFKLTCNIDRERGRFFVGFGWSAKDDPAAPKPKVDASNVEGHFIDVAMRRLLVASFGPVK